MNVPIRAYSPLATRHRGAHPLSTCKRPRARKLCSGANRRIAQTAVTSPTRAAFGARSRLWRPCRVPPHESESRGHRREGTGPGSPPLTQRNRRAAQPSESNDAWAQSPAHTAQCTVEDGRVEQTDGLWCRDGAPRCYLDHGQLIYDNGKKAGKLTIITSRPPGTLTLQKGVTGRVTELRTKHIPRRRLVPAGRKTA